MITFGHLDIDFDDRVLEPRQWTVRQARWAAELLEGLPAGPVLELCAGAGQIGLLTVALSPRRLVCVDASPVAGRFIEENARRAGLEELLEVRVADVQHAVGPEETFALVIADPPWVRSDEVNGFPEDPAEAIDGGEDGLAVALQCVRVIEEHLLPGGQALIQLGDLHQAEALGRALAGSRLTVGEVVEVEGRGVLVQLTGGPRGRDGSGGGAVVRSAPGRVPWTGLSGVSGPG